VLDECFNGHEDFSVKDFVRTCVPESELVPVTVQVAAEALERFRAEMPGTPLVEEAEPGGAVSVELLAFSLDWFAGWLLGFGTKVEVVSPDELRVKVREAALAVAERYAEVFAEV
jgi:predicted DNA-binding transcriptional regulator YafY